MNAEAARERARGEQELEIDGRSYDLRPTPKALMDIEAELQIGVVPLIAMAQRNEWGLTVMVAVLWHCLKATTPATARPSRAELAEHIVAKGLQNFISQGVELLSTIYGPPALEAMTRDRVEGNGKGPAATT